jgi:hypothetical protein
LLNLFIFYLLGSGGPLLIIQKSTLTVHDIKDVITKKYPGFAAAVANAGPMMEVYEIHFNEAEVTVGYGNVDKVTL